MGYLILFKGVISNDRQSPNSSNIPTPWDRFGTNQNYPLATKSTNYSTGLCFFQPQKVLFYIWSLNAIFLMKNPCSGADVLGNYTEILQRPR
jgi:hypothetical protein